MRLTNCTKIVLIGASLLALSAGTALATSPSGETPTPLARGTLVMPANVNVKLSGGRVKLQARGSLDALLVNVTLAPGGTGGWHTHTGPLITVVQQGTLTIFDARCKRHDIPAGSAMISSGSSVSKSENLGSTPAVFDVTFFIPHGASSPRIDQPAPTGCNA
jgi:quercetin dioxygenase-like cupin family protein